MAHLKRYTGISRHRVARRGRSYYLGRRLHNPDWKIIGFAALVGVAGTVGASYLLSSVDYFNTAKNPSHWWATPALFLAGGALLLGKMPLVGAGLATLAGIFGYTAYTGYKSSGGSATGFNEAGAFYGARRDSGLYEGMGGVGALVGPNAYRTKFNQGAVGALIGPNALRTKFNQGAVGAVFGYGEAGRLGMD